MKKFKYKVIKNAVDINLANFIYNYFLVKRDAVKYMYEHSIHKEWEILGIWNDKQVPNTYVCYGDFAAETLLLKMIPLMEKHTGFELVPTYSFTRLYKNGDILARHKDRPSCEISATMNLGGDPWPIFIDETGEDSVINWQKNIVKPDAPKGTEILLEPGDMLAYSGCDLEHWREPFEGNLCGQVFLHYNDAKGEYAEKNRFDKRFMLGLPYNG